MRQENFVFLEQKYEGGPRQDAGNRGRGVNRGRGQPNPGNFRGGFQKFRGGGRQKPRGPRSGRGGFPQTNQQSWSGNEYDQPGPSGQNNNRGQPRGKKKGWSGGRGGSQ